MQQLQQSQTKKKDLQEKSDAEQQSNRWNVLLLTVIT